MTWKKRLAGCRDRIMEERFSSRAGALFFTGWIVQRVVFRPGELLAPTAAALLWWVITLQFALFVTAFLTRSPAHAPARGFMETVFPLACAALPFALIVPYPFRPPVQALTGASPLPVALAVAGTLLIVAGVIRLRRSFAIMTEVRMPVYGGVYRWTRHPMYVGSMLTALGALLENFSPWNSAVWIGFCACQIYRARLEERKIHARHPDYGRYAAAVGWIGPFARRRPGP